MTQLSFAGVRVEFGATRLLDDVTFTVTRGERWGIIGRNGAGKTTLFRLATGELQPASGSVARASGLRISLLDQQRDFAGAATVWEAAAGPFRPILELERSLAEQAAGLAEAGDRVTDQALRHLEMGEPHPGPKIPHGHHSFPVYSLLESGRHNAEPVVAELERSDNPPEFREDGDLVAGLRVPDPC